MGKKVNGLEREAYIEKYRDTDQKILAGRLFDKCYELQGWKEKYARSSVEQARLYTLEKANERLKNLFESYGYKPTRYIVAYAVKECKAQEENGELPYDCEHDCDECEYYYEDDCVGTFGFYDFDISSEWLTAIDVHLDEVNLEATWVKEEKTGKVIWKKGRK